MNETTPAVWARIIRVDLDGLVEVCNCARLIVFGGKRAAALPVSLRRARVDTESAILLGDSAIEILALIIDCATAAITRSVLGIGGYRRIAIVERPFEGTLATILFRSRDAQAGKVGSTPLVGRDRVRASGEPLVSIRLRIVTQIAVVGRSGVDQCCEQNR
jgi:hypothetical protein